MHRRLAEYGGTIDAVFTCLCLPRHECECFKPRPSVLHEIAERLHVSLDGVRASAARRKCSKTALAAGARPIRVRTGKAAADSGAGTDDFEVQDDLAAAVDALLSDA